MDDVECSRRGLLAAGLGLTAPLVTAGPSSAAGSAVIACRKVPVGGGVVVPDRLVVVTQPRKGRFHVFSARCTHQGCTVSDVSQGRIYCPCHGGEFAITTGRPVAGPPPSPLPAKAFRIKRGKIYLR